MAEPTKKKTLKIDDINIRDWLNPVDSYDTGSYKVTVSARRRIGETKKLSWDDIDIDFIIADCNRQVSLSFSCSTKKAARERLQKVAKLERALSTIRGVLDDYLDDTLFDDATEDPDGY